MSTTRGAQVQDWVTTWLDAVLARNPNVIGQIGSASYELAHTRTTFQRSYPSIVFNQAERKLCPLLSLTNQVAISLEALGINLARRRGRGTNTRTEDITGISPGTLSGSRSRGIGLYFNPSFFRTQDEHLQRLRDVRRENNNRSISELLPDGSRYV